MKLKYSLIAMLGGQEFTSKNNTKQEFNALVRMIYSLGGYVVEYTEEEIWQ